MGFPGFDGVPPDNSLTSMALLNVGTENGEPIEIYCEDEGDDARSCSCTVGR
jgi:hypothetical protein